MNDERGAQLGTNTNKPVSFSGHTMSYCELGLTQERMASSIRKQTIQSLVSSLGKSFRFLLSISSTSTNFFLSEAGLLTTGIVIRVLLIFFERLVFLAKLRLFIPVLTLAK